MNRLVVTAFLTLIGLSSCGTPNSPSPTTGAALSAQATVPTFYSYKPLLFGLWCPPDAKHPTWWYCGSSRLYLYSSGMAGNIIPADMVIQGDKAIYNLLGSGFKAQLPSSGYTKFFINGIMFTVDDMDKSLFNAQMYFNFSKGYQLQDGSYEFNYSGKVYTAN